jgi:hypothetical protein
MTPATHTKRRKNNMLIRLRHAIALLLAIAPLALGAGCATPDSSAPASASASGGASSNGRIVDGPANPTSFRPDEPATVVIDVDDLDLRQVFETIGEDATLWYQHVQTLANPYFEGRVNESTGTERAREYMEFHLKAAGLEPAFPAAADADTMNDPGTAWVSFQQPFDFQSRGRVTATVENARAAVNGVPLEEGSDYTFLGISASGEAAGPLSFVGYGIESGPDGYTSFSVKTDLTGRIALLLRYEPLDADGGSQWSDERFSRQAALTAKMSAVQRRGAAGIILVNPPDCPEGRTGLESLSRSARLGRPLRIPVIQMTPEAAGQLLAGADPSLDSLLAWRRLADEGAVKTRDLPETLQVSFGATVERSRDSEAVAASNVGGVLRGRGALANEWLVIGGHYDHNGYGMFGTTPDRGPLFPGADDNASGTAGVLVLAARLSKLYEEAGPDANLRSVLFIAFDAEERRLHGSRYYVDHPTVPADSMIALLNMDMIGRLRDDRLSVIGVGTGEGMLEVFRPSFEESGLTVAVTSAGSGRSDDANFHRVGVPAVHFFTGMHPEYTQPTDKAYTVNPIGAAKILALIEDIAMDLAQRSDQIAFADPGSEPSEDRGYARVRLGIRPGMGEELDTGILIDSVTPGMSADAAGMKPGDILLSWDDTEVDSLRTLFEIMQDHQPGDIVQMIVDRKGRRKELSVTLKGSSE